MANPLEFTHLFNKVSHAYCDTVGVNDPSYIRVDCPTILRNMVLCLIENESLQVDDKDAYDDESCYFSISTEYNESTLQDVLSKLEIPHTFTVENIHAEHDSNHYRYVNGEYRVLNSNEYSDLVSATTVLEHLEQQAFTALRKYAQDRQAMAESWGFTPEDESKAKQLALAWTVKP